MINKLTDKFYFQNCGSDGWQTILEKKIANFIKISRTEKSKDITLQASPKDKLSVSIATPEDAYEITKLAYFTYRYSYTKTLFYYPEILKESIETSSTISFIVKTEKGVIVGHSAYIRSPYCHEIIEAGGMMTLPAFRKTSGILRLVKKQHNYPYEDDMGAKIVESNLITTHTGSQRITRSFKFKPMALKLSVHDCANFMDISENRRQRETLLYSIWAPHGLEPTTIFIPETHSDIINKLVTNAELPIDIKTETSEHLAEKGSFNIEKKQNEGLATLMVEVIGSEWKVNLKKFTRDLNVDGFKTLHLKVPISAPLPKNVDRDLKSLGFFFSGIIPRTPKNWLMLYTYLNNQNLDFSSIALCDETAIFLKNYIETGQINE